MGCIKCFGWVLMMGWGSGTAALEPPVAAAAQNTIETPLSPETLLQQSLAALAKVQDYSGVFTKQERFGDKLVKETMRFKYAKPHKIYLKFLDCHNGREVIYATGWNGDQLRVHKGSFPDITLSLDPRGSMAMENNHHPVTEFGLEHSLQLAASNLRKATANHEGSFSIREEEQAGRSVYHVSTRLPKKGVTLKVRKDETLWDVARRSGQDMYWILYASNGKIDGPDDIDEDDMLFVPTYYSGRSELIIDRVSLAPIRFENYDWSDRLYEAYDYRELVFNSGLSTSDFDPNNKSYNF